MARFFIRGKRAEDSSAEDSIRESATSGEDAADGSAALGKQNILFEDNLFGDRTVNVEFKIIYIDEIIPRFSGRSCYPPKKFSSSIACIVCSKTVDCLINLDVLVANVVGIKANIDRLLRCKAIFLKTSIFEARQLKFSHHSFHFVVKYSLSMRFT